MKRHERSGLVSNEEPKKPNSKGIASSFSLSPALLSLSPASVRIITPEMITAILAQR